ncbi:DUF3261 domain-containing protein [Vibrio kyushuensis]|uniref:DUF3261 domain-containing protein n=1 Tax=Vibrio kyushuensis TaxID=2910249 RepID=UPI003D0C066F
MNISTLHNYLTKTIPLLACISTAFLLSGCSLVSTPSSTLVEISPSVFVPLPSPDQLGYNVTAGQLISATWPVEGNSGKTQNQQLPVHLEVTKQQIVLAGFSSWGTRILSLDYQKDNIETSVLSGLENTLPAPEQILFNLMITLWPISAWEAPLNQVKWKISETEYQRTIFDAAGSTVIVIEYENSDPLSGLIQFENRHLGYTISIQTLNADIVDAHN